ncbi:MAG: hypothetical protein PHE33_11460 [Bacteroidales bacterium]|nr:hypothetical protein [Bacteroidales bacterium]
MLARKETYNQVFENTTILIRVFLQAQSIGTSIANIYLNIITNALMPF